MNTLTLSTSRLSVAVSLVGAELQHIERTDTQLQYLWQGDDAFWNRKAPILFPIVGRLKNDRYRYANQEFSLPQHGFARDAQFEVLEQTSDRVCLVTRANEHTRKVYPFDFELYVTYALHDNRLVVTYGVKNPSNESLYFSIGAHPGFRVPLFDNEVYTDYYLEFDQPATAERWLLVDGLIDDRAVSFISQQQRVPLSHQLFEPGAVVLKQFGPQKITLGSRNHAHGLHFEFKNYPYLGIWAKTGAPFVCIEPWHGIADGVNATGELEHKEGIICLPTSQTFECEYSVDFF